MAKLGANRSRDAELQMLRTTREGLPMKKMLCSIALCGTLAVGLTTATAPAAHARPGGCLKYGLAGAVAGHMVHHGIKGAMAGCAAGMYRRHLYNKRMREERMMAPANG